MTTHNVKSFGAVGDNLTDDFLALQAAATAALEGDEIFYPAAQGYLSSASVVHPNKHIKVFGDGQDVSPVRLTDTAPPDTKLFEFTSGFEGVEICHLLMDGQGAAKTYDAEGELIHSPNMKRGSLHHLHLINSVSEAVDLDYAEDMELHHIEGDDCGGNLIHIGAQGDARNNRAWHITARNCSHRRALAGKANPYAIHISGFFNRIEDSGAFGCANGFGTIEGYGNRLLRLDVGGGNYGFHGGGAALEECVAKGCDGRGIIGAIEEAIRCRIYGDGVTNVGLQVTGPLARLIENIVTDAQFTAYSISSPNAHDGAMRRNEALGSGAALDMVAGVTGWLITENYWNGASVTIQPNNTDIGNYA